MRAAVYTEYGGPDVVRVIDVEAPRPGPHDLLVRVHATTVNRTDCAYRAGAPTFARVFYGIRGPKAKVLGCEFAGMVVETGVSVTAFAVGDRVFGYVEGPFGAHAELLVLPQSGSVTRIPPRLTFEEAAPGTEGSHYALGMIRAARVGAGDSVLVNGATGGIGSAAVQLLHAMGVAVTAVCFGEHVDLVRGLGADRVIDCTAEDFTRDAARFDVFFDAVGKSTFTAARRVLSPHGIYLSSELGPRLQNPRRALLAPLSRGQRVLFPIPTHNQAMVEELAALMESGAFRPLVDRTYPLAEIAEAHRYAGSGQKIGNVVVSVASSSSSGAGDGGGDAPG
jgi:NADPH:quinone reductase-like Zn-dependent oxidoreductase